MLGKFSHQICIKHTLSLKTLVRTSPCINPPLSPVCLIFNLRFNSISFCKFWTRCKVMTFDLGYRNAEKPDTSIQKSTQQATKKRTLHYEYSDATDAYHFLSSSFNGERPCGRGPDGYKRCVINSLEFITSVKKCPDCRSASGRLITIIYRF